MIESGDCRASRRVRAIQLLLVAASGCDFTTYPPAGAIGITLSDDTVAVAQASTGSVTVTLDRRNGFADSVGLLVEGLPASVSVGSLSLAPGESTGTLSFTVAGSAATDTSALTVHAHATGPSALVATAGLSLVVRPGGPGFFLGFDPAIVGVSQGTSRTTTVTIGRLGGLIGAVDLAVSSLPPGVTALLNPSSVYATTSTLTLTASPTAGLGAASVAVSGTAVGAASQSEAFTVNVTPGGGGPSGNVSVAFCPVTGAPIWVAFQDGTGPWVLSTDVNGAYSGQVSSGRGGVASVVAGAAGGYELEVRYGTTAELQALGDVLCYGSSGSGKSVNVTVAGTGPSDFAFLGLGTSMSTSSAGTTPPFSNVPDGPIDLVAARGALVGSATVLDRLFIQSGISPAAGSSVAVDFGGPDAIDPVPGTVTVGNLGGDQATVSVAYRTPNRTLFSYAFDTASTSTSRGFGGFPASAGSFHRVDVRAAPNLQTFDRLRTAAAINGAVGNRTLTLGAELGTVTVAQAGPSPPLRLEAVVPATGYSGSWSVTFTQESGAQYRSALVQATAGYVVGGSGTVLLTVPDLSTVAGYDNSWGLGEVATTGWLAVGQTMQGFGAQGQWQEGATLQSGARYGTFSHH